MCGHKQRGSVSSSGSVSNAATARSVGIESWTASLPITERVVRSFDLSITADELRHKHTNTRRLYFAVTARQATKHQSRSTFIRRPSCTGRITHIDRPSVRLSAPSVLYGF